MQAATGAPQCPSDGHGQPGDTIVLMATAPTATSVPEDSIGSADGGNSPGAQQHCSSTDMLVCDTDRYFHHSHSVVAQQDDPCLQQQHLTPKTP